MGINQSGVMGGANTVGMTHTIAAEVYSKNLKMILEDELSAAQWVDTLTDFPDGEEFVIPSIGTFTASDYQEDDEVAYQNMSSGKYVFRINRYIHIATYITEKLKQDSSFSTEIENSFVPGQARAIMEQFETDVFRSHREQTAGDENKINGMSHRFIGTGKDTAGAQNQTLAMKDIAYGKLALTKANVPLTNLTLIVPSEVAYQIEVDMLNKGKLINNPTWEGIVRDGGFITGFRFNYSIDGVDVYSSEYLDTVSKETIGKETIQEGKAAYMFANISGIKPFLVCWRQAPKVDIEFNKDRQRTEYLTTARYGVGLKRPENCVVMLLSTTLDVE